MIDFGFILCYDKGVKANASPVLQKAADCGSLPFLG